MYSNSKDTYDDQVADYFKSKGYDIVSKGGYGKASFDVVAKDKDRYIFVEVKSDKEVSAVMNFTYKKVENIYLKGYNRSFYKKQYEEELKSKFGSKGKDLVFLYLVTVTHQMPFTLKANLIDDKPYSLYLAIPRQYEQYLDKAFEILNKLDVARTEEKNYYGCVIIKDVMEIYLYNEIFKCFML